MGDLEVCLRSKYSGPRKIVLCGKVAKPLSDKVRELIKEGKYVTLNDFVEEAILEKVIKIEWDKVKNAGE